MLHIHNVTFMVMVFNNNISVISRR